MYHHRVGPGQTVFFNSIPVQPTLKEANIKVYMSETGSIFTVEVQNTTALNKEAQKQPPKSSTSIKTSEASAKPVRATCRMDRQ